MLKFNIKFIGFLLFILFVNSVFANSDLNELLAKSEKLKNDKATLEQLKNNQKLTQIQLANINNKIENIEKELARVIDLIVKIIDDNKSIYFTGKDRVWKWHPSFDFASITIHHRVKIHTRPSIYAPVRGWTEHEDIFISIGDIQSGPGSIRGWGRPVSYKETKDGWINLDQLNDSKNILWCIGQYDGTVIRYYHWENGVTKFHDEAYCVDPR